MYELSNKTTMYVEVYRVVVCPVPKTKTTAVETRLEPGENTLQRLSDLVYPTQPCLNGNT